MSAIRDRLADHLLTPQHAALRVIDSQPSQEGADFLAAVRAAGRRRLVLCALWTEMCIAFPALDALREGYDVYPVVDAIAGTSVEAHRAGRQPHRAGWRTTHQRGAADV